MPIRGDGLPARRVARLQEDVRRAPSQPAGWVALGHAWIQAARDAADPGLYLNADACAARAEALAPGSPGALTVRAAVHLEAHRFDEARAAAEGALARAPEDRVALGILADALVELGRYDDAVAATDRLMKLRPGLPAYTRASYLLWLRGREAAAVEAARRAIDAAGDAEGRAFALVQAALLFWQRGDVEGAAAGFDLALQVKPGYPPALVGRGRVALARGKAGAAVAALLAAWQAAPHAETAWLLGDAREAIGDRCGAEAAWAEVVRLGRAGERRVLAAFLATKGREPEEAVRLAQEEQAVRPDIYSDDTLAWALFRAGRLAEATEASGRALRLGTPDPRLLYHAGAIRLAAGARAEGRALLARALARNAHFDWTGGAELARLAAAPATHGRRAPGR